MTGEHAEEDPSSCHTDGADEEESRATRTAPTRVEREGPEAEHAQ